jgi:hypothetical protein
MEIGDGDAVIRIQLEGRLEWLDRLVVELEAAAKDAASAGNSGLALHAARKTASEETANCIDEVRRMLPRAPVLRMLNAASALLERRLEARLKTLRIRVPADAYFGSAQRSVAMAQALVEEPVYFQGRVGPHRNARVSVFWSALLATTAMIASRSILLLVSGLGLACLALLRPWSTPAVVTGRRLAFGADAFTVEEVKSVSIRRSRRRRSWRFGVHAPGKSRVLEFYFRPHALLEALEAAGFVVEETSDRHRSSATAQTPGATERLLDDAPGFGLQPNPSPPHSGGSSKRRTR